MAREIGPADPELVNVIHGDFCFPNILFDFRAHRVKLIDPRAIDAEGRPSIFGDARYETAKLYHSAVGLYDHIIAGFFDIARPSTYAVELTLPRSQPLEEIQALFVESQFRDRTLSAMMAHEISILLFLSMLPLHSDALHRQWAFLANALRLYQTRERV